MGAWCEAVMVKTVSQL